MFLGLASCQYPDEIGYLLPDDDWSILDSNFVSDNDYEIDTAGLTVSQKASVLDMYSCNLSGVMNSKMLEEFDVAKIGFLYRNRNGNDDKYIVSYSDNLGSNVYSTLENLEQGTQYEYCMFLETGNGAYITGYNGYFETYSLNLDVSTYSEYGNAVSLSGTFNTNAIAYDGFELYVELSEYEDLLGNIYYSKKSRCTVFSPGEFTVDFYDLSLGTTYYIRTCCVYKSKTYTTEAKTFTLN